MQNDIWQKVATIALVFYLFAPSFRNVLAGAISITQ
jgi:hypothetical protein